MVLPLNRETFRLRKQVQRHKLLLFVSGGVFLTSLGIISDQVFHHDVHTGRIMVDFALVILSISGGALLYDWIGGSPELLDGLEKLEVAATGQRAAALGITKLYRMRDDAIDDMLADLRASKESCRIYAAVKLELTLKDEFEQIIRSQGASYVLTYTSFPDKEELEKCVQDKLLDDATAQKINDVVDVWSLRDKDLNPSELRSRIKTAHSDFENKLIGPLREDAQPRWQLRLYKNYLSPHSMLIIDNTIVYLSLYDAKATRGTQAPTLRLEGSELTGHYIGEADIIDNRFSVGGKARA